VGTEKRTRLGRVIRNAALRPLTVPLTGGHGNPWIGGDRTDSPIAMVRTGTDPTPLRLRVPVVELQKVVETVGREAAKALREATSPRPDAAESDPSGRCLQIAPESPPETH
jgi:hypothetical protein